jgi:DNA-binding NarL/FixJ family response regulator
VRETGLGADAIELVESYAPDLLVLDQMLPDLDGLAVYHALRAQGIRTKVLVYTTYTRSGRFVDWINQPEGPDAALDKSASVVQIRTALVQVLTTDTKYIPESLRSREPSSGHPLTRLNAGSCACCGTSAPGCAW